MGDDVIYEGTPYPQFRLKVLVADLIRSSPHFTGANQEALSLAEKIMSFIASNAPALDRLSPNLEGEK